MPSPTSTVFDEKLDVVTDSQLDRSPSTGQHVAYFFAGKILTPYKVATTTKLSESVEEPESRSSQRIQRPKDFSKEYIYGLRKYYVEKIQAEFGKLLRKQGDVSSVIYFSQIKDIILQVYDEFISYKTEEGFLHVIGLLHSSIVKNKWRQYSEGQIKAIDKLLLLCLKNADITMKDVIKISREMNSLGIDSMPVEED